MGRPEEAAPLESRATAISAANYDLATLPLEVAGRASLSSGYLWDDGQSRMVMRSIMTSALIGKPLLEYCTGEMDRGGTMHHPFLLRFEKGTLGREQVSRFLIQWYKTAQAHREAFPGLIANIKDDDVRFDLIEILNEEYGSGDRSRIHGRILDRLLKALDLTPADVTSTKPLPAIVRFSRVVSDLWSTGEHPVAFGLHFGLEYLASAQQHYCARGMAKYDYLTSHDREYFDLHVEAEVRHVATSENGFLHYAEDSKNHEKLLDGVRTADRLLGSLWDELDDLLFET